MACLSQWNFGNDQLEGGDEVTVSIHTDTLKVKECGINVVYEEQVENDEEDTDNHDITTYFYRNEVIRGDLSNFQLSTGAYFLSRRFIDYWDDGWEVIQKIIKDIANVEGMQVFGSFLFYLALEKASNSDLDSSIPHTKSNISYCFCFCWLIAGRTRAAEGALCCIKIQKK